MIFVYELLNDIYFHMQSYCAVTCSNKLTVYATQRNLNNNIKQIDILAYKGWED